MMLPRPTGHRGACHPFTRWSRLILRQDRARSALRYCSLPTTKWMNLSFSTGTTSRVFTPTLTNVAPRAPGACRPPFHASRPSLAPPHGVRATIPEAPYHLQPSPHLPRLHFQQRRVLQTNAFVNSSTSPSLAIVPSANLRPNASGPIPGSHPSRPIVASFSQSHAHAGKAHDHSHGHGFGHHHHHHDNTYLISKNKKDAGVRITRIGLFVNLGMAVSKGVGGYVFHSQALIADAIHSLTDLVSDFMTLATVTLSNRPPSDRYPTGYGKIESLGSLGVSGLLLTGGILMGWGACDSIFSQLFLDGASTAGEHAGHAHGHGHGFGHSHSHADFGPNINAIWIVGASIIIKEYLYRATMKIAVAKKSTVLASNAVHHRVDSLSSLVALVAIFGSWFMSNAAWLDPAGGLLVSLMVIRAGWSNTGQALLELADSAVDADVKDSVRDAATASMTSLKGHAALSSSVLDRLEVRDVQGIKSGQNYLMELQLAVPPTCAVAQLEQIEKAVREQVGAEVKAVRRLKIRFVALDSASKDFVDEFIPSQDDEVADPEGSKAKKT